MAVIKLSIWAYIYSFLQSYSITSFSGRPRQVANSDPWHLLTCLFEHIYRTICRGVRFITSLYSCIKSSSAFPMITWRITGIFFIHLNFSQSTLICGVHSATWTRINLAVMFEFLYHILRIQQNSLHYKDDSVYAYKKNPFLFIYSRYHISTNVSCIACFSAYKAEPSSIRVHITSRPPCRFCLLLTPPPRLRPTIRLSLSTRTEAGLS